MNLKKITQIASAAYSVYKVGNAYYTHYNSYRARRDAARKHYLSVSDESYIYEDLLTWVNKFTDGRRLRVIDDNEDSNKIGFAYDGDSESKVTIDGHEFTVVLAELDGGDTRQHRFDSSAMIISPPKRGLVFSTCNADSMVVLRNFLSEMHEARRKRANPPQVLSHSGSYWMQNKLLRPRDINSVILRAGETEALLADLERFKAAEEQYNKMGMPWHRGYLLYGPPGNGKTSLAQAVAYHYGMDLYALSLSGVSSDSSLVSAINGVGANSVVLMEDVDVYTRSVSRDSDDGKSPTLAGLLNSLDGVHTPHGMITFITTNHVENLDRALIRSGRIDYRLELLGPDYDQIQRAFQHVYGEPLNVEPREFKNMADLMGVMKANLGDPEGARLAIKADSVVSLINPANAG